MYVFFDSHGNAHTTCSANEPGAGAFGPTGISRPLTAADSAVLGLPANGGPAPTPWSVAHADGRVVPAREPEEWDHLARGQGWDKIEVEIVSRRYESGWGA